MDEKIASETDFNREATFGHDRKSTCASLCAISKVGMVGRHRWYTT